MYHLSVELILVYHSDSKNVYHSANFMFIIITIKGS